MARIRTIKPDFFKNESLAELTAMTRLLFIGLWTQADREGRLEDRPKRLKVELFPYDNFDMEKGLNDLQTAGLIIRYKVNVNDIGRVLTPEQPNSVVNAIQIVSFSKHQVPHYKEVPSIIPPISAKFVGPVKVQPLTEKERRAIFERDGEVCKKCYSTEDLTIDHIIPITKGGGNEPSNLQVLCRKCNSAKNNRVNHDPTLDQSCTQEGKGTGREQEGNGYSAHSSSDLPNEPETPPPIAPPPSKNGPPIADVIRFFCGAGGTEEMAQAFWNKWESTDWMDGHSRIKNWTSRANNYIATWYRNDKNGQNGTIRKQTTTGSINAVNTAFADIQRDLDAAMRCGSENT